MVEAPKRLKRRREFLHVARQGRKCATPGLVLQARKRSRLVPKIAKEEIRVGFTVSRKVGKAVIRNKARRRLRAAAEIVLKDHGLGGYDYVLIGRAKTPGRQFGALLEDLDFALKKLRIWKDKPQKRSISFQRK